MRFTKCLATGMERTKTIKIDCPGVGKDWQAQHSGHVYI